MKKEKSNRNRNVTLRFTMQEYSQLKDKFTASTCHGLSEFIRKHLFTKPIVTTYRNLSLDDLMEETIVLTNELTAIGKNINQIAKKINTADSFFEFKQEISILNIEKKMLFRKIEEIRSHTQKIAEQWLQL
ncbi:plasmid mobilization protein [Flavobacterium bizetiae]|uniref:plasmid mobilization protein n=1 Tax=Flavobacterium bizetiae TaxID=2704140 RepID=UPI00375837F7